jgi:simple sugar transport system substrate-binding protein
MRCGRTLARRTLLRRAAVTAAALYASSWPVQAASKTVVGFIYVGPRDDFGYNQAHAQGAVAVQKTMGSMITLDGATLLFSTSFGYFDPHVPAFHHLSVARFCRCTILAAGMKGYRVGKG